MNILFENSFVKNEEWAKDVYGYIYFRRPSAIICLVIFGSNPIFQLCNLIAGNGIYWSTLLISLFVCAYFVFMYKRTVKTVLLRDMEIHGKRIEITLYVTDENIKLSQSTGSELYLNYYDIKKAVKTKKYIYLWSKTNMIYTFKKDSFSVGDENGFIEFLKSKGIKIK